jgi:hypothetical protein
MLEVFAIVGVIFFIAVLFYKQANESFEVIQLEAERLQELPTLYADHAPIVVRGFQVPPLGSQKELEKRQHILNMAVATNLSLKALLQSKGSLKNFTWKKETAKFLSRESGLQTWFEQSLFTQLLPSSYTKFLYSSQTFLYPDHRGLFKTKAFQTVLMPTQGTAIVSVMLPKAEPYLPNKWEGRQFESLTPADTPLLSQIQSIDVKVKKGNMLLLPAHLIISVKSDYESSSDSCWIFCAEVHHWISRVAS